MKYFVSVFFLLPYLMNGQASLLSDANRHEAADYYALLGKAASFVIQDDLKKAVEFYSIALDKYDYPFLKHIEQAVVISGLAKDTLKFSFFLDKCIEHGLPVVELKKLRKEFGNELGDFIPKPEAIRQMDKMSIDSSMLFPFLEFEAIFLRVINKDLRGVSFKSSKGKRKVYKKVQKHYRYLIKEYSRMIDSIGFPSEHRVGFTYDISPRKHCLFKKRCRKVVTLQKLGDEFSVPYYTFRKSRRSMYSAMKPGNWALSHFPLVVDSVFLQKVINPAFDSLALDQGMVCLLLEPGNDDLSSYDMAISRYSPFRLSTNASLAKRYNMDPEIERVINEHRNRYYIRTVPKEKQLIKALYRIKRKGELMSYPEMIKSIRGLYRVFIVY